MWYVASSMYGQLSVSVVVPAYNEIDKIGRTIASVPAFVDRVIVVDDGSKDGTGDLVARTRRPGLELVRHLQNRGVGSAIASGYRRSLELGTDAACVMAGDAQMDPS